MKPPIIIATCLAFTSLISCKSSPSPVPTSSHYINNYQEPIFINTEVNIQVSIDGVIEFPINSFYLGVRPYENWANYKYEDCVSRENVEEIAKQFNDVSYNRSDFLNQPFMYRQTVGLDIISDNDYDADHPAGSLLNDIMTVNYNCCDKILNPPYNFELTDYQESIGGYPWKFQDKLSDFNRIKPTLVSFWFDLHFTAAPATTSTHRFTVTYKNIDGVELSSTTEPVTIKP